MTGNHYNGTHALDYALRAMVNERQSTLREIPHRRETGKFQWSAWLPPFRRGDAAR